MTALMGGEGRKDAVNVCGAANTIIPIQLSVYKFRQCGILEEKTQEETLMNVNDPRWASIDAFVEGNRDNILRDITRLVAVPSVEGTATATALTIFGI